MMYDIYMLVLIGWSVWYLISYTSIIWRDAGKVIVNTLKKLNKWFIYCECMNEVRNMKHKWPELDLTPLKSRNGLHGSVRVCLFATEQFYKNKISLFFKFMFKGEHIFLVELFKMEVKN